MWMSSTRGGALLSSPISHSPVNASHNHGSSCSALVYASTACSDAFPLWDKLPSINDPDADDEEGLSDGRSTHSASLHLSFRETHS